METIKIKNLNKIQELFDKMTRECQNKNIYINILVLLHVWRFEKIIHLQA